MMDCDFGLLDSNRNGICYQTSWRAIIENGSKREARTSGIFKQITGKGKSKSPETSKIPNDFTILFYFFFWQEELLKFRANLKRQLQLIRMNSRPSQPNTVPTAAPQNLTTHPSYDRQNSDSSTVTNDDGWVLVPSQNESDA